MQRIRGAVMVAMVMAAAESMSAQATTPTPLPAQTPAAPAPGAPAPGGQPPVAPGQPGAPVVPGVGQLPVTTPPMVLTPACPAPVPPATVPTRAFTGSTGLLLHQVAPTRTADFERLLGYVREALEKTTNATLRNQAKGWRFFKVSDLGPNGDIMYAFLLDPAVPCVDYALAPILADAYPDTAQLTEIWNLYKSSVRTGGTIMNLVPLSAEEPEPFVEQPVTPVAPAGTRKPVVPAGTEKPAVPAGTEKPVRP